MKKIKAGLVSLLIGIVSLYAACDLVDWNDKWEYISSGTNPGVWTSISTNYIGQVRIQAGYTGSEEKVLECLFKVKNCLGTWDIWDNYTVTNRSWAVDSGWWNKDCVEDYGIYVKCRIVNGTTGSVMYEYAH